jgi:hypothetical protein
MDVAEISLVIRGFTEHVHRRMDAPLKLSDFDWEPRCAVVCTSRCAQRNTLEQRSWRHLDIGLGINLNRRLNSGVGAYILGSV